MQSFRLLALCAVALFSINLAQAADMSAAEEWLIKAQIKELSDSYGIHRDNNDHDGYANTFAEDGELILYGNVSKGRDEIRARAANASDNVRMHVLTSSLINVIDSENATGVHYITVFSAAKPEGFEDGDTVVSPNFRVMGKYHDKYVLTDEGWKFAERRIEPIFSASE